MPGPVLLKSRIAGRDREGADATLFDDINPATGEVICRVAAADAAIVDEAVASAGDA